MSVLVSGILKSPAGAVIAGAQITLTALTTSPDLLAGVSASAVTSDTGYYGLNVLPGAYSLTVAVNGKSQVYGSFRLDGTETTVTLNMVLRRNLVEVSIPDALLVDFRQIQNNVADDLEAMRQLEFRASDSADNAARAAADAKVSAEAAARSEANAAGSEKSAEQFAQNLQSAVTQAGTSASAAALSASTAEEQAAAAKNAALETAASKDATEKAASNASLLEKNAANSAFAAKASEASAVDSATKADASEKASALHEQSGAIHETNAGQSAGDAALSAIKAADSALNAGKYATEAAGHATDAQTFSGNAKQAATDATAATDEIVRQVTGFDTRVNQQTDAITKTAQNATTKASSDITATGEMVKQAIQTQGQQFVDAAHTEATSASQSAQDAQTASQVSVQAKMDARTQLDDAVASATRAEDQARKSADAATQATTAATEASNSATQAQEQAKHLAESVTQAQTSAAQAADSADVAQKALKDAQDIAKTPGPSAYDVWKAQQPADADTSMTAYLAFQEGKLPPLSQFGEVRSYVWGKILTQYLDSRKFPNVNDMANTLIPGNCIAPVYINFHLGVPSLNTRDGGLSGTWRIMSAMTFYQDNPVTLLRRII
ncbi:TPA: carboxypeptidase-like regulatory domain-containing protein [Salmonella enterica subsp. enterica serovar Muenchen]